MDEPLCSTDFLLGFSDEHVKVEGVVDYVTKTIRECGIVVKMDRDVDVPLPEGIKRFLIVTVPQRQIEEEAELQGYIKETVEEDAESGRANVMEFTRATAVNFKNYGKPGFFTPSEEAQLSWSVLERVGGVEGLSPHLEGLPAEIRRAALKVPSSIITAMRIAGVLEVATPLHQEARVASLWKRAKWRPLAPTSAINDYFGSHVSLYFAWMNFFTSWLLLPSAVGFLFWLHIQLSDYSVDDHPYLPFYSLFVIFWSVVFLRCWDREASKLAWKWGNYGFERKAEIRPEFQGQLRRSRVTGRQERYYPRWRKLMAYGLSAVVTGCLLCVAFVVMVLSLNLQGYIDGKIKWEEPLYFPSIAQYAAPGAIFDPNQTEYFGLLAFVPCGLHVLVIMQLNAFYRRVAERLTANENHRYEEDHENSLILKRFFFEAFDCYIALFYIGFVQQSIVRLRAELISLYCVDSFRRVGLETLLPLILKLFSSRKVKKFHKELAKADGGAVIASAIIELSEPEYEQFDDFLEMVIEFGYVTLFAAGFPLGALLSVFCNLIEVKSDLFKLTNVYQRPRAARTANIGMWRGVVSALVWLSIFTNVMLFATSEQLAAHFPSLYRNANDRDVLAGRVASTEDGDHHHDLVVRRGAARWVILIAFGIEHVVYLLAFLVFTLIPAEPEEVVEEVARLEYLKEEALKAKEAERFQRKE